MSTHELRPSQFTAVTESESERGQGPCRVEQYRIFKCTTCPFPSCVSHTCSDSHHTQTAHREINDAQHWHMADEEENRRCFYHTQFINRPRIICRFTIYNYPLFLSRVLSVWVTLLMLCEIMLLLWDTTTEQWHRHQRTRPTIYWEGTLCCYISDVHYAYSIVVWWMRSNTLVWLSVSY
jgi:hypothetical protein